MADPKEWGPLLWKIIHTTCEHLGNATNISLQKDELVYFKAFQRKLLYVIPCKICRTHYRNYMVNIRDVNYEYLKPYAQTYFFDLHNQINITKNQTPFNKEDLKESYSYSKKEYIIMINDFNKLYSKYTNLQYISMDELKDFNRILTILRKFIDF